MIKPLRFTGRCKFNPIYVFFVNTGTKSIVAYLQEHYDGGPDFTFECVGNVHVMRQALESCHKGNCQF